MGCGCGKRWSVWLLIGGLCCTIAGCQRPENPSFRELTMFAAASTLSAVDELSEKFHEETGILVKTSYAASSTLATTLNFGARADLFLSANSEWADAVAVENAGCQVVELLGNRLVVVVPSGAKAKPESLSDLVLPVWRKIAIADPLAVPAGIYARQALQAAGIWNQLESRLVGSIDVRQALTLVEQRAVDCGIVYLSDARDSQYVQVAFSLDQHEPIVYPLVLMPDPVPEAEMFFRFLQSETARAIFSEHGFAWHPN